MHFIYIRFTNATHKITYKLYIILCVAFVKHIYKICPIRNPGYALAYNKYYVT